LTSHLKQLRIAANKQHANRQSSAIPAWWQRCGGLPVALKISLKGMSPKIFPASALSSDTVIAPLPRRIY